jgi:Ser/Thr protein kinase RdoA (MazF antagonist)
MTHKEVTIEQATLDEVARRYGVPPDSLTELSGGWVNHIYGFERDGVKYVLRLSPAATRPHELVCAEADWINYLSDRGVPAACVVGAPGGNMVEDINLQGGFTVAAYERAPGHLPGRSELGLSFWNRLGGITGRMHRLTKDYVPAAGIDRSRAVVDGEFPFGSIPAGQESVIAVACAVLAEMATWPRDRDSWGLIHGDLHPNNLFVTEAGEITLFDFDEYRENWFVVDVATALYFGMWSEHVGQGNRGWYRDLLDAFTNGYARENALGPEWLGDRLQLALKCQELWCYATINDDWHLGQGGCWADVPAGWKRVLERYRRNIEEGIPVADGGFNIWKVEAGVE